jgi:hypothetical protein
MRLTKFQHIPICILAFVTVACNKVPDYVIQPEDMAELLADIHTGESVVEIQRVQFQADSLRKYVKQSIYLKHGVTAEQVDTSFVWYGHHIDKYMDVYDRTIEILEDRLKTAGNLEAEELALSISGDSADVWTQAKHLIFTNNSPSNFITFSIKKDSNWEKGDSYAWRIKATNNSDIMTMQLSVEYQDGSIESNTMSLGTDGWHDIKLLTDSTKDAEHIYGYVQVKVPQQSYVVLDSISLVRNRVNSNDYQRYHQRIYKLFCKDAYKPQQSSSPSDSAIINDDKKLIKGPNANSR